MKMTDGQVVTLSKRYPARKFKLYDALNLLEYLEEKNKVVLQVFPGYGERLYVSGVVQKGKIALTEVKFLPALMGKSFTLAKEDFKGIKDPLAKAWIGALSTALSDKHNKAW